MTQKQSKETTGQKSTDTNRIGDILEHYVITEALKCGAEVFPNSCCTGRIDMILKINGRSIDCDVKSMSQRAKGRGSDKYYHVAKGDVAKGVYMISVHPETLLIAWHPLLIPEGLESFWDNPSTNT